MISYIILLLGFNFYLQPLALKIAENKISVEVQDEVCLSKDEKKLYDLINAYRKTKKLKAVPLSSSLTKVAKAHAVDLMKYYKKSDTCNPHSWSKNGSWTSCCYTNDHKQAECMWNKPKEIAGYDSPGYEIVYWHSAAAQPEGALQGWQKSKHHNEIIINDDMWKQVSWNAMGVAIYEQYAVVWFGAVADEKGEPKMCR